MKRKIIQILETSDTPFTALCDDGTIWYLQGSKWHLMEPQIPQDFVVLDDREPVYASICTAGQEFPCNPGCEEVGCMQPKGAKPDEK